MKIIIVDNSSATREELAQVMVSDAASVECFATAEEAIERLEQGSSVTMLLVSASLPGYAELLTRSTCCGLEVPLLFRAHGQEKKPVEGKDEYPSAITHLDKASSEESVPGIYFCRTSFGDIKIACHYLQSRGMWWEVQSRQAPVQERYRKLLNRVHEGIVELDSRYCIRWANKYFKDLLGDSRLVGKMSREIVCAEDVPCLSAVSRQIKDGIYLPFQLRLKNGLPVEVDATPRYGYGGVYMGTVALVHPVENATLRELETSRNLGNLYSLALSLSKAFGLDDLITIVSNTLMRVCNFECVGVKLEGQDQVVKCAAGYSCPDDLLEAINAFCGRMGEDKSIRIIKDASRDPEPASMAIKKYGYAGIMCVPLVSGLRRIGHIWGISTKSQNLSRERSSFVISVGAQAGIAMENALNVQARIDEQSSRRRFYRDALQALTSGKLVFCEHSELDEHWQECGEELGRLPLREHADVAESRHVTEECMNKIGFDEGRTFDMVTCVSEASTNVVKYGPPGEMIIKADEAGVKIRLDDVGPGISFANLPKAVLLSGFSTQASLGLGYSVIMEMCDQVHMATSEQGTSLILEMLRKKEEEDPLDAFIGLAKYADF